MFKSIAITLTALTAVSAFPLLPRTPPPYRSCDYLEEYDVYLQRFNALGCGEKASSDAEFYTTCCYPLHKTESLADKPAYCTPPPPPAPSNTVQAPPAESAPPAPEAPANPAPAPPSDNNGGNGGDNGGNGGDNGGNGGNNGGNGGNDGGNGGGNGGGDDGDDEDCSDEPEAPSSTVPPAPQPSASEPPSNPAPEPSASDAPASSQAPEAPASSDVPTPSSQEPAPPAESQTPPDNGGGDGNTYHGFATFFYQNGNPGACGEYHSDNDFIAAISEQTYGYDYSKKSDQCGKRVRLTNDKNGQSVEVVIVDSCPTCDNPRSLDLSKAAFLAIAPESDGQVPISWNYI